MKKLFTIFTVLVSVVLLSPTFVEAAKNKSPTSWCSNPDCGAPSGGLGGEKCLSCAAKDAGLTEREFLKRWGCGDQFFMGGGPLKNRVC